MFAAASAGAVAGLVFGALIMASSLINWSWLGARKRWEDAGIYTSFGVLDSLIVVGFVCVYALCIGGAVGGIVGLALDVRRSRQLSG